MPEAKPWGATVVVLCRDNPVQLGPTLDSALAQSLPGGALAEVLVVDGSRDGACAALARAKAIGEPAARVRYWHEPPQGPYAAMNAAVPLAQGRWLLFLNAGDAFAAADSLAILVRHAEALALAGSPPPAVFGQAWIEPTADPSDADRRWLSPDPGVRRIERWLQHMVPCHQAVLFERRWAQRHPYDPRSGICADRVIIRRALAAAGPGAYRPEPVCRFRLDGVSSALPDLTELKRRWAEPSRRPLERLGEVGKLLLRPMAPHYPRLMRLRARWMGLLC